MDAELENDTAEIKARKSLGQENQHDACVLRAVLPLHEMRFILCGTIDCQTFFKSLLFKFHAEQMSNHSW